MGMGGGGGGVGYIGDISANARVAVAVSGVMDGVIFIRDWQPFRESYLEQDNQLGPSVSEGPSHPWTHHEETAHQLSTSVG